MSLLRVVSFVLYYKKQAQLGVQHSEIQVDLFKWGKGTD